MFDHIPNDELVPDSIPADDADWYEITKFALTYDGYIVWSGNAACATIAHQRIHDTLSHVRTCLFYEQRRHHHYGECPKPQAMVYIRGLIKKIRAFVAEGGGLIGQRYPLAGAALEKLKGY